MNVADFMQWLAVARRHPLSALCGGVVALCVGACWWIFTDMRWLSIEHGQLNQDTELAIASMISGPSVRQELAASREVTHRLEDNLVNEDNLAENLWYFYKIEQQTKAHMVELRPLNSVISGSSALYKRVPFVIRVTGTYEQTGAFLYAIETGPRLANITGINFRRVVPDGLSVNLDTDVELLGKR